jgi:hypothetical protein
MAPAVYRRAGGRNRRAGGIKQEGRRQEQEGRRNKTGGQERFFLRCKQEGRRKGRKNALEGAPARDRRRNRRFFDADCHVAFEDLRTCGCLPA